jgi:uncharacterized protein YkwD
MEIRMSQRALTGRVVVIVAMAAAALGLASPAALAAHATGSATQSIGTVRTYDRSLLIDVNSARTRANRHHYAMNTRLRGIALRWAQHLADVGALEHNPNLVREVTKACPHWTSLGENVGEAGGSRPRSLFSAYMHSPEHKANILDRQYTVIGIETVTVARHGVTQQWNVMDFANHCGS